MRRASKVFHGTLPTVAPTSENFACSGKRQYPGFKDAQRVAEKVRQNKDGERMAPYRCRHCQSWHIGGGGITPAARARKKGRS